MSSILFTENINSLINLEENKYKNIYFLFETLTIDEIEHIKNNVKNINITFCVLNSMFFINIEEIMLLIDKYKVIVLSSCKNIACFYLLKNYNSTFFNCNNLETISLKEINENDNKLNIIRYYTYKNKIIEPSNIVIM